MQHPVEDRRHESGHRSVARVPETAQRQLLFSLFYGLLRLKNKVNSGAEYLRVLLGIELMLVRKMLR